MATSVSIKIHDASGRSQTDINNKILAAASDDPKREINEIIDYLSSIACGHAANIDVQSSSNGLVAATGTVTFASVANNDTITINGVVFTAKTASPSGDQFLVGVSNTADAAAAAVAINASTTAGTVGYFTVSAASGVLTITAVERGIMGNAISVASSNGTRLATGGTSTRNSVTYLSGGTGGNSGTAAVNYVYAG